MALSQWSPGLSQFVPCYWPKCPSCLWVSGKHVPAMKNANIWMWQQSKEIHCSECMNSICVHVFNLLWVFFSPKLWIHVLSVTFSRAMLLLTAKHCEPTSTDCQRYCCILCTVIQRAHTAVIVRKPVAWSLLKARIAFCIFSFGFHMQVNLDFIFSLI